MKALHQYSDRQIHLFLIAFFLLCTMIGFELAMYMNYSKPEIRTTPRTRIIRTRANEEEEEEENLETITLEAA
jgi:hypothetical protein